MKILIPTLYSSYGGSVYIAIGAYNALKDKYNVTLRANLCEANSKPNFTFTNESLDSFWKKIKAIFKLLYLFPKELFFIHKLKPNVIYLHDNISLIFYGIIGKLLRIKVIWHIHQSEGKGVKKSFLNFIVSKKIYVSKYMFNLCSSKNDEYVPNFITPIEIKKRDISKKINIFVVGSINQNKNQLFALSVFYKITQENNNKNYNLFFCGDIIDEAYFKELQLNIKKLKLEDRVKYLGYKTKEYIYSNSDIIFSCSKYESFGLVFLEALYYNKIAIFPNIFAFREIAEELNFKSLYESKEILDCIDKIKTFYSYDKKDYTEAISSKYSFFTFQTKLLKIFEEIQ